MELEITKLRTLPFDNTERTLRQYAKRLRQQAARIDDLAVKRELLARADKVDEELKKEIERCQLAQ